MYWPWKNLWWVMWGATLLLIQVFGRSSSGCFPEEKAALLEFKASMKLQLNTTSVSVLDSWVNTEAKSSNCCGWERVTCDSSSRHIIHLSLHNLYGDLEVRPSSCEDIRTNLNLSLFVSFKELRSLNFSSNCFDALILERDYRSKSTLKRLEIIDLSFNFLNESIMESLSALTFLKNLFLSNNHMRGPLPIEDLSLLRNLEVLDLSYNGLSSPLTTQGFKLSDTDALYKLKKLKTLDLSSNLFDKGIFKYLATLPALRSLLLSDNNIEGGLDAQILGNLSKLEVLIMRDSKLNGPFPIQGLCKMEQLEELDLSKNSFIGTLDTCLGNLTSLRALDFSLNSLSGSIPSSFIAPLTSLEYLSLSYNKFEGLFSLSILANHSKLKVLQLGGMETTTFQVETENPPWIPSFQLEYLKISSCQVNLQTKMSPMFLSNQHSLRYVDLSNNNLTGMFPNWFLVNNPKLEVLLLNDNSFTGPFELPFDLNHHMDTLHILDLSKNQIQGQLPNNIGFFLPHLERFDVSKNMFDGHIPASIGEMSNLKILDLAYNNFSGQVPKHILLGCISLDILRLSDNSLQGEILSTPMNMRGLSILMIDNNQFNGTMMGWNGSPWLTILSASRNNFEGAITEELCQLVSLMFLDLSHNRFSGAIPSCFNMRTALLVHLRGNSLTGTIPEALIKSPNLFSIDLRDNKFTGSIPESIYRHGPLRFLLLAGNQLQGQLSNQICQLTEINILDLSRNNFTGTLPSCLNNLSFGVGVEYNVVDGMLLVKSPRGFEYFYEYPHFTLTYDDKVMSYEVEEVQLVTKGLSLSYRGKTINTMSGLDLSSNQFIGEIPQRIGDLHALRAQNLSYNHLSGPLPESFHKLENIESLDLSNNNLSGQIPSQLQDLHSLSVFNVSYNNLSGRAPDKGQFGTFDDSSYKGNPYLTWHISNRGIAPPPPSPTPFNYEDENNPAIDFTIFYWSFAASYVIVLLMLLVTILWINPHWRRAWLYFIEGCLLKCFGRFLQDAFY